MESVDWSLTECQSTQGVKIIFVNIYVIVKASSLLKCF
jgi:hypothetical protein